MSEVSRLRKWIAETKAEISHASCMAPKKEVFDHGVQCGRYQQLNDLEQNLNQIVGYEDDNED